METRLRSTRRHARASLLSIAAVTALLLTVSARTADAGLNFGAGFGSAGVFNFGPLGSVERVVDPAARRRDRLKSAQIGVESLAIGLAVGIAAALLPLR